jgi:hypothetical protein
MNSEYLNALIGPGGCITTALADGQEVVLQVAGECMQPAIGHQALVRLEKPVFYLPGDVIAFHCPNLNRLMVHRFLGYVWRRSAFKLMTKADQGAKPDPLIDMSAVLGRVAAYNNRAFRISLVDRLVAIFHFVLSCVYHIIRQPTDKNCVSK